jgi:hypothetical protein
VRRVQNTPLTRLAGHLGKWCTFSRLLCMLGSLVLCSALVSYAVPFRSTLEGMSTKTDNSALACIGRDEYMVPYHVSSLSVSTSRQTYAEMLSAVNTETTFPLS